jgi:TetR/AcrR family transcriptional regulator, cholesterol catabolism regulator
MSGGRTGVTRHVGVRRVARTSGDERLFDIMSATGTDWRNHDRLTPLSRRPVTTSSAPEGRSSAHEAIFTAATRLFGERGYSGTTMRDIAREVGILPGSLYAHIASKDALLLDIIEGGVDRFNAAVDVIEGRRLPPEAALRAAVHEHLAIVAESPERTLIVFHQWRFLDDANRDRLLAKRAHYEDFYLRTLRAGMAAETFDPTLDPKVTVLAILGALNWTPEWFSPTGAATSDEIADKIADGLLRGVVRRT